MGISKITSAISEVAAEYGISICSGERELIANSEIKDKSIWIIPPQINRITGIFDREKLYRIELFYIEFIKSQNNPDLIEMVDLMSDFVVKLHTHRNIEQLTVNKIETVKRRLTAYGERAVHLEFDVQISDCKHLSIS
jgi:hypothetical protein